MDFADLYQEACVTFCKAKDKYEPNKGVKFSTYLARAVELNFWALYKKEARRVDTWAKSMEETIGEDDGTLHDVLPNDDEPIDDAVAGKEIKERQLNKLSPLTKTVIDLLEEPPEWLVAELSKVNYHVQVAKQNGIPNIENKISLAFLFKVLGITSAERAEIYREIKAIADISNG